MEEYGYIYCFSNLSMPNILKIGMTTRHLNERLSEANKSDTWRPPTPYEIEIAKKVSNPKQKEKTLHILLSKNSIRINPNREFFNISIEEVLDYFDLMDGELIIKNEELDKNEEYAENEEYDENEEFTISKGCRVMNQCFTDGQKIRHSISIKKIWYANYDLSKNGIIYNGKYTNH